MAIAPRSGASSTYDGDGVTLADADGDGVPDKPDSSLLRSYTTTAYDDQGRVYQSTVYSVDPSSGAISDTGIVTNTWYDHRGNVIETSTSGSAVTKASYDGADRPTVVYTTDGGGGTSWSDALNVTGDTVLEQIEYTYDANGNVIETADRQRFNDASGTGALGDPSSTDQPKARVYYTVDYYDAVNRLIADVDVGTNGGSVYTRPSDVPARSDEALVISYTYNDAGWVETVTDPQGIVTRTLYDNLGQTHTIAAWDGSYDPTTGALPPSEDADQTTEYTYDDNGDVTAMTALSAASGTCPTL